MDKHDEANSCFCAILQTWLKTYFKCILYTEYSKFAGELTNDNNTQAGVFVRMMIMSMMMAKSSTFSGNMQWYAIVTPMIWTIKLIAFLEKSLINWCT